MSEREAVLPIVEERVSVGIRDVVTGRVRVETKTETIVEPIEASLVSEGVEVRRVPVDREVEASPPIRTEGNVTIIPVLEEVLVVEKRLILKEEIHLVRTTASEVQKLEVERRRQQATVSRIDGPATEREQP